MSEVDSSKATRRLVSAGAVMASGTMISRLLGFLRVSLLAVVLGNGTRQADAYAVATTVPNGLYILFAGGALNTVLVPQLVRAVRNDPDDGEAYTNRIMTAFLLIIGVVALVLTLGTPLVTRLYSDGSWRAPELAAHYHSMVLLAYFCLPEIFFYGVFYLLGQVLNARDRFGPMMWAPIANNVVQLGVLGTFLAVWGHTNGRDPFTGGQIWLLGGGHLLGIIFQTVVMVVALRRVGYRYRPRFDLRGTGLGHTFQLAKWTLGFVLVNQLALVVVTRLATSATSHGTGAGLTVYNNAYLLFILPHSLITVSLVTAMLPSASRAAAEGDLAGVRDETVRTTRLVTTLLLPAAVAFIALAQPMAHLMFGNGQGVRDASYVGWTLAAFAVGLVPFTIQYIYLRAFYALEDTRATFFQQCIIAGANIVLGLVLVLSIHRPEWVAPALALAFSLAYLVGVVSTYWRLSLRLPGMSPRPVLTHLGKVFLAIAPGGVLAWWITSRFDSSTGVRLAALAVAGVLAVLLYLLLGRLLKIPEISSITSMLRRRGGGGGDGDGGGEGPGNGGSADEPEPGPGGDPVRELAEEDADQLRTELGTIAAEEASISTVVSQRVPAEDAVSPEWATPADETEVSQDAETGVSEEPPGLSDDLDLSSETQELHQEHHEDGEHDDPDLIEDTTEETHPIRVHRGQELGGRYRLEEPMIRRASTQTWRAFDEVLSRSVLVHLLPATGNNDHLLAAARQAAVATDSRFLRILDAGVPATTNAAASGDQEPTGPYIVCEYAPGQTLQELLASGPLSALEAAWLVREVADALAGMHHQGLYHERISPETVFVTVTGNIKIVGFLLEAEMAPSHHEIASGQDPETVDVMDLGRLLYCTLVSRWPGGHAYGMPSAPMDHDRHLLTPRQVRAGVSPALDRICDQILSETPRHRERPLRTAQEVVGELTRVLGTADAAADLERRMRFPVPLVHVEGEEPPVSLEGPGVVSLDPASARFDEQTARMQPASDPDAPTGVLGPLTPYSPQERYRPDEEVTVDHQTQPRRSYRGDDLGSARSAATPQAPVEAPSDAESFTPSHRPERRRWVGFLVVVVLAVMVASLITVLTRTPNNGAAPAPAPAAPAPTQWPIATAVDFDPQGDDRHENPDQVRLAHDGNPATAWQTVTYRDADLSVKDGLGIVVDLGQPRSVGRVELRLAGQPTAVELRVPSDAPDKATQPSMQSARSWRMVAENKAAPDSVTLTVAQPVQTRFLLVYLTRLPAVDNGFRGGIAEIQVWS